MKLTLASVMAVASLIVFSVQPVWAGTYYLTVAGLGGETDYEQRFTAMANDLNKLFSASGSSAHVYTLTGSAASRAHMIETFGEISRQSKSEDDFVLILIGHGSFDGVDYKFNLVGPDISGAEIASLCDRLPPKRQLVINTTSASGGSIAALAKPGRAIVAATKAGTEKNATVFARFWVEALHDPTADLDKNGSISALEAFQFADRKTAAFYDSEKRLATEHPVFEDTGKAPPVRGATSETGQGRFLSSFTLLRIGAAQLAANDPTKRDLLAKKDELEQKIDELKYQKAAMAQDDYKKQLTESLIELARVQQELDK